MVSESANSSAYLSPSMKIAGKLKNGNSQSVVDGTRPIKEGNHETVSGRIETDCGTPLISGNCNYAADNNDSIIANCSTIASHISSVSSSPSEARER